MILLYSDNEMKVGLFVGQIGTVKERDRNRFTFLGKKFCFFPIASGQAIWALKTAYSRAT
jgi:hypothetical protein